MAKKTSEYLNYSQYLTTGISEGDNLWGFEIDVNAYIACNDYCTLFISQERTNDPNCMLILTCQYNEQMSFQQIADFLEEKWLNHICYRAFEKHYIEQVGDELIFYYVTRSEGLGVTGKIIIQ